MHYPDGEYEYRDPGQHEECDREDEGEEDHILVEGVAEDGGEGGHAEPQAAGQAELVVSPVAGGLAVDDGGQDREQGQSQPQHHQHQMHATHRLREPKPERVEWNLGLPEWE